MNKRILINILSCSESNKTKTSNRLQMDRGNQRRNTFVYWEYRKPSWNNDVRNKKWRDWEFYKFFTIHQTFIR